MEFHQLGDNCTYKSCNQLDFLPFRCDACQGIYCKEHYTYSNHQCENSYLKDKRVPSCPICNEAILIPPNCSSFDLIINRHIENQCLSDLAIVSNKKAHPLRNENKCSFKHCRQRELLPFLCKDCHSKFCITHRLPFDHHCYKLHKSNYINSKDKSIQIIKKNETSTNCDTNHTPKTTSLMFSACVIS